MSEASFEARSAVSSRVQTTSDDTLGLSGEGALQDPVVRVVVGHCRDRFGGLDEGGERPIAVTAARAGVIGEVMIAGRGWAIPGPPTGDASLGSSGHVPPDSPGRGGQPGARTLKVQATVAGGTPRCVREIPCAAMAANGCTLDGRRQLYRRRR